MGITKPPAYEHPRKRKGRKSSSQPPDPVSAERTEPPNKRKKTDQPSNKPEKAPNGTAAKYDTEVVRLVAHVPIAGQLKLYDEMIASDISPREAMHGLLRNSKSQLIDLAQHSSKSIGKLKYDHGNEFVETNWSMSTDAVLKLKSVIDPFGILSPRAFGSKLAMALIVLRSQQ